MPRAIIRTNYGVSLATAGERGYVAYKGNDVAKPPLIWVHGSGENADAVLQTFPDNEVILELAEFFTVYVGDLNNEFTWGNDTHVARIEAVRSYLASAYGSTGKVTMLGVSMGHTGMANYTRVYPNNVRGYMGIIPVCDLIDMRDNRGYGNNVNGSYPTYAAGSAQSTAEIRTHSPIEFASTIPSSIPIALMFSDTDNIVVQSTVLGFYVNRQSTMIKKVGSNGHSTTSVVDARPYIVPFARNLTI